MERNIPFTKQQVHEMPAEFNTSGDSPNRRARRFPINMHPNSSKLTYQGPTVYRTNLYGVYSLRNKLRRAS